MTVLEADQNGLTRRQIAELLWGEKRVAHEWYPDGWMHARAMLNGYRDMAAGR